MAKTAYKIPDSLDKSFLDMEIAIRGDGGVGLRPLPIKILLGYIASGMLCFIAVSKSFVGNGGLPLVAAFVVLWIALTVMLLKVDDTDRPQASLIVTMLNYLPKHMRYIITRNDAKANDFRTLTGIDDIDEDTGLITFTDGTVGYVYRVVGTGSILLFEEDRDAILDRVDSFYRKMRENVELLFITTKEAQKVYRQVANVNKRYQNLDVDEPDLKALADMEYDVLRNYVGSQFRSIHQYLILKAQNAEALVVGRNVLQSEVENSSLVFKQCTALFGDDIYDLFRTIYRGKESV